MRQYTKLVTSYLSHACFYMLLVAGSKDGRHPVLRKLGELRPVVKQFDKLWKENRNSVHRAIEAAINDSEAMIDAEDEGDLSDIDEDDMDEMSEEELEDIISKAKTQKTKSGGSGIDLSNGSRIQKAESTDNKPLKPKSKVKI